MRHRPNIEKFQKNLAGLVLGHGTRGSLLRKIREEGLTNEYNYACVGEGWEMEDDPVNVTFRADDVLDRTYPDPEGQWGEHFDGYSMEKLVEKLGGLDAALDELERCFAGEGWIEDFDDRLNPRNYNLVVVGPVPPSAIIW